jgi:hypothetical protein
MLRIGLLFNILSDYVGQNTCQDISGQMWPSVMESRYSIHLVNPSQLAGLWLWSPNGTSGHVLKWILIRLMNQKPDFYCLQLLKISDMRLLVEKIPLFKNMILVKG